MGEVYKGLTIRIGADTSKLTIALKNVTSNLNQVNSQLRTMERALKFDPTNMDLLTTKSKLLSEKANVTRLKILELGEAIKQLGEDNEVVQLANDTEKLASRSAIVSTQYAEIEDRISATKDRLVELFDKAGVGLNRQKVTLDEFKQAYADQIDKRTKISKQIQKEIDLYESEIPIHHERYAALMKVNDAKAYQKTQVDVKALTAELKDLYKQTEITNMQIRKADDNKPYKRLAEEAELVNSALNSLESQVKMVNNAIKLDPKNFDGVITAIKLANEHVDTLDIQIKNLNQQLDAMKADGIKKTSESTYELTQRAAKAKQEFEQIVDEIASANAKISIGQGDVKKLESEVVELKKKAELAFEKFNTAEEQLAVRNLESRVTELNAKLKTQNSILKNNKNSWASIRDLATTLAATVTPLLMTAIYKVIASADEMDTAFRNMKKTVQGTEEQFEALRESAMKFSETHAVSAEEILNIEALAGQLGVAVENLESFATVVSNLDIATDIDAEEVAVQLGQMMNVLGMTEDELNGFGDALVRLGNNMPAQESAIMDIASRMMSLGSIVGMSADELLAWAAAAASTGQGSEALGTNLSKVMGTIEAAVGAGGDALADFANIAGVTSEEFAKTWNENPTKALRDFIAGLKEADECGESVDAMLQDMGITSIREKTALEGLTQTVDTLDNALQMSSDAWNGISDQWGQAGDAAREAANKSEGFSGALQILENSAQNLGATVGEALVPFLKLLANLVQDVTAVLDKMGPGMKTAALAFTALVAAVGPAFRILGQFKTTMDSLKASQGAVITTQKSLASSLATLKYKYDAVTGSSIKFWSSTKELSEAAGVHASRQLKKINKELLDTQAKATGASAKLKALALQAKLTALQSQSLALALNVAKGAIAMVALDLVIKGVSALTEAIKYSKEYKQSTESLTPSLQAMASSVASSYGTLKSEAIDANQVVKDSTQSILDLYDSISQIESDAAAEIGVIQHYLDIVRNANEETFKNAAAKAELEVAISNLNQSQGESITLEEVHAAVISGTTNELYANADAYIANAQKQAYAQIITEAYTECLRIQSDIQKVAAEAQAYYNTAMQDGYLSTQESIYYHNTYTKALEDLQAQYDGMKQTYQNYIDGYDDVILKTNEASATTVTATDVQIAALKNGGDSFELFSLMSDQSMSDVIDAFKQMNSETGITLDEFVKNMTTSGENGASGLANGIESGKWTVTDKCRQLVEAALAKIRETGGEGSPWSTTAKSGLFAAQGFAKGVENGKYTVLNAAANLVANFLNRIKKDGEEHSPWKTTRQSGLNAALGLAEGMKDGKSEVVAAYESLYDLPDLSLKARNSIEARNGAIYRRSASSSVSNYSFTGDIYIQAEDVTEAKEAADVITVLLNAKNLGKPVEQ